MRQRSGKNICHLYKSNLLVEEVVSQLAFFGRGVGCRNLSYLTVDFFQIYWETSQYPQADTHFCLCYYPSIHLFVHFFLFTFFVTSNRTREIRPTLFFCLTSLTSMVVLRSGIRVVPFGWIVYLHLFPELIKRKTSGVDWPWRMCIHNVYCFICIDF